MMKVKVVENDSLKSIIRNMLLAAIGLFFNGFGTYLTINANIGVAPWDVLSTGISNTFNILYGNATIIISLTILLIDILLREPIGIAMFIDAFVVGKSVDFFNYINIIPKSHNLFFSIVIMIIGFFIIAYTQYLYMVASLGCGPRDTLLVGLKRHLKRIPIGLVSISMLGVVTFIGYLLGGDVGVGTLICAFGMGPIMQLVFELLEFDATKIKHQKMQDSLKIIFKH